MWSKNGNSEKGDLENTYDKYYFDFQHLYQQDTCFRVPAKLKGWSLRFSQEGVPSDK